MNAVTYLVAERREGRWLFGDDWQAECATREEAEEVAESWRESGARYGRRPQDVAVFAVVPVAELDR